MRLRERRKGEEERRVEVKGLDSGEELPLFVPTPSFVHLQTRSRDGAVSIGNASRCSAEN